MNNEQQPVVLDITGFDLSVLDYQQRANLPAPSWLVQDVWPDVGTTVLAGRGGSFKSFIALDWACRAALGLDLTGNLSQNWKPTKILFGYEDIRDFNPRMDWALQQFNLKPGVKEQLIDVLEPIPILRSQKISDAAESLAELIDTGKYGALVIDTFQRFRGDGDENSAVDCGMVMSYLDSLHIPTLLVHHSGKGSLVYRGSSALRDDARALWGVLREGEGLAAVLYCDKMRYEPPKHYRAALKPGRPAHYMATHSPLRVQTWQQWTTEGVGLFAAATHAAATNLHGNGPWTAAELANTLGLDPAHWHKAEDGPETATKASLALRAAEILGLTRKEKPVRYERTAT